MRDVYMFLNLIQGHNLSQLIFISTLIYLRCHGISIKVKTFPGYPETLRHI